jgi:hypothetical protein
MRDTQPTKRQPSKRFLDMALKTKSWMPVSRDGWIIKFSIYRDSFVLLTIISQYTGQCIIRHFKDEDEAVIFINMVTMLNAEQEYEL